ncbi:GnsA/GnsB family addiction module toxin [Escherichia coli]
MNIEELKKQAKWKSPTLSRKKLLRANKNTGKEVSEIRFTARANIYPGLKVMMSKSK